MDEKSYQQSKVLYYCCRCPVNCQQYASCLMLNHKIRKLKNKTMNKILIICLTISVCSSLSPAFQSVIDNFPHFSYGHLRYYVNNQFQTSLTQQNYWEPRKENRANYITQYNHYAYSLQRYPFYAESFGPSRHSKDVVYLMKYVRTMNGTKNNQNHQNYCASERPLSRSTPPYYSGTNTPISSLYNPRVISNQLGNVIHPLKLNKDNVTMAFTIWGQFIDHDISLSRISQEEKMNIQIPKCDPFMDASCEGNKFIPFERSLRTTHNDGDQQLNSVTGWIDGSMVYGSNDEVAHRLRTFKNGKMKVKQNNFLPNEDGNSHRLPDAGDQRAAENLLLLSYHTIFVREHNRMCDIIVEKDASMTDGQIYEAARNYVIGLIQKITYDDFLPILLGRQGFEKFLGSYKGYNPNIDPTILNQFSTIAYRFGHSIIVGRFPLINEQQEIEKQLKLNQIFFKPDILTQDLLEKIMRGLTYTIIKERDGTIIDQIRNLLISGPENRDIHLDLFALNIQRAIDHGIQKYNYLRKVFGLTPLKSFEELTDDLERARILNQFYHGDINRMDPWVGIINEKSINGGILGELGSIIVGTTFKNLRDGDRFWYEKVLNHNVLPEIKGTFLAEILVRNTKIRKLQQNIFYYRTDFARAIKSH